jgi:hypothetical protein
MERAAWMGEEDLEPVRGPAIEQQAGARPAALVDRHPCRPSGPRAHEALGDPARIIAAP